MNDNINEELLRIVDQVTDMEKQRVDLDKHGVALSDQISRIEEELALKIAFEMDDKGKPRYPNEKARNAALNLQLKNDSKYDNLKNELLEVRHKGRLLAIECVRLKARYQVLLAFAAPNKSGSVSFPSLQDEDLNFYAMRVASQQIPAPSRALDETAKNELLEIENQIAELATQSEKVRGEINNLREQTQAFEDQILLDIAAEKDTKGKPVYPNEQTRDAAVRLRLKKNSQYQEWEMRLRDLERESEGLNLEILELENRKNEIRSGTLTP